MKAAASKSPASFSDMLHGSLIKTLSFVLTICPALVVSSAAAAASSNATYYAVYCSGNNDLSLSSSHQHSAVSCGSNSTPGVETKVQSLNSNPKGTHGVTIVEADCYPGTPQNLSASTGRISCSEGPDATLTLGSHFPAAIQTLSKKTSGSKTKTKSKSKSKSKSKAKTTKTKTKPKTSPTKTAPAASQSPISGSSLPQVTSDSSTIKTILQIAFGIIGAFALLSVSLSGFKYITAAGNPQKTSEAKSGVAYAIVGLMIAIAAEAIVAFVVHRGAP